MPNRTRSLKLLCVAVIFAIQNVASWSARGAEFDAAALEFFETQVRPILVQRCYQCHSAEAEEVKGGLWLDSRKAILRGGDTGAAIVAGKPSESLLIDAINHGDVYQMPPKSKLPDAEIAALMKWVALGAPWPTEDNEQVARSDEFDLEARKASHWCWQPLREPTLPQVQRTSWPREELDYFILAKLDEHGLAPAPTADKRTLLRRVYFDLIGLPPTPEAVEAFLADRSPRAFEKVVDDLLASPHFGERWARHWMDVVRYAETYGHEFDYAIPHAWKYRDYLIRAFNADVPYDQFVREHLAGDLLDKPRLHPTEGFNESMIGPCFWWFGEATHAPVDVRGDNAARVDNQLDVFGKAFLALTIGCARCHDHKFDAISTQDYYALAGFLRSSRRHEALLDHHGEIARAAKNLGKSKAEANAVLKAGRAGVELTGDRFARLLLASRDVSGGLAHAEAAARHDLDPDKLSAWMTALTRNDLQQADHPLHPWYTLSKAQAEHAFSDFKQRIAESREQAERFAQQYPLLASFTCFDDWHVRGEAFGAEPTQPGEWDSRRGGWRLIEPAIASSHRTSSKLQGALRSPTFTLTHPFVFYRLRGQGAKVRLVIEDYFMDQFSPLLFRGFSFDVDTKGQFLWHQQAEDVSRYVGHRGYIEILDQGDGYVEVDEIRFSEEGPPSERLTTLAAEVVGENVCSVEELARAYGAAWQQLVDGRSEALSDPAKVALWNWVVEHGLLSPQPATTERLAAIHAAMSEIDVPRHDRVLSLTDGTGEDQPIYIRGNHRTPGQVAPRQMLTALCDEPRAIEIGSGRLQLAEQLVDPSNPLTARVMVNRLWHHMTGRGIVASTDNFGVLGEEPTHPELLDFLAVQFMRDGWSVKRLLRSVALSSTYQMSSKPVSTNTATDPENLLLHRMRIRRLEGEAIRDAVLAISGRLDSSVGGESVAVHITPFMQGRGRPKDSGPLDGEGRRSLYTEVRRNFLPPMMLAFDTPIPFNAMGRRNVSNVPAQALIMMNDPFLLEQAKCWARRTIGERATAPERIRRMYQAAFARPPTDTELADAVVFLQQQAEEYELGEQPWLDDERVWTDLCHVLMNVKEFVFVN